MRLPISGSLATGLARACLILAVVILGGCNSEQTYTEVPRVTQVQQSYHFTRDVKPILEQKCIACHACNDAPCQLKLEASEGLERGASKIKVYDGSRTEDIEPTRLHIDAQTPQQWRKQGFYSVLANQSEEGVDSSGSLVHEFITLGMSNPVEENKPLNDEYKLDINREFSCPAPSEFADYAEDHPTGGMPYGVSGLTNTEYKVLSTWLEEGAVFDAQAADPSKSQQQHIKKWEDFLNQQNPRAQLVSRYLFEHLFLAHLYFSEDDARNKQFFQVVRSSNPAPEPINVIATTRPNDEPGTKVYYRLRPITDTLIHKTHIVYRFDDQRMDRYQELFLEGDWQVQQLPGYTYTDSSNPFLAFEAIPAKARYQFMLDEAEYFTRTFIRGPVCRGQIATDVIRDQFWVMFEDPEHDQYIVNPDHRKKVSPLLGLPGQKSDILDLGTEYLRYQEKRNQYRAERSQRYHEAYDKGLTLDNIWDGDNENNNAFLSIFRHHDSASVERGWIGRTPKTLWLMDYPLFERTYYELVVNFNVYGSVSHQAQTRLYFDLIRNGGESNFMLLLPPEKRQKLYASWYEGSGEIKTNLSYQDLDTKTPTAIEYNGKSPVKQQLIDLVLKKFDSVIADDPINRCRSEECAPDYKGKKSTVAMLQPLVAGDSKQLKGIQQLPEVTVLRVDAEDGEFNIYSLIRNRAHTNVAFMLGEEDRYKPDSDSLTIVDFPMSSYPNYLFRVSHKQLPEFVDQLIAINSPQDRKKLIDQWGIRRSNPEFWKNFHSMTQYLDQHRPMQSGIFDLNRYEGW
ncbi:fatty acid cis/trans isomerase [Ketobacter sp.]